MSAISEFLKAILGRPTGWFVLALASGTYLALAHAGLMPQGISNKNRELLAMGALGTLLVSGAWLGVQFVAVVGNKLRTGFRTLHAKLRLQGSLSKLPTGAQALVYVLAMRNEGSIWLIADFAPALDARRANFLRLITTNGRAFQYEFDFDIRFALQSNLELLDSLTFNQINIDAVVESERNAHEHAKNSWMRN